MDCLHAGHSPLVHDGSDSFAINTSRREVQRVQRVTELYCPPAQRGEGGAVRHPKGGKRPKAANPCNAKLAYESKEVMSEPSAPFEPPEPGPHSGPNKKAPSKESAFS